MRLRLKPRDTRFFDLFGAAGTNIVSAVAVLREFATAPTEQRLDLAKRMHDTEHAGDEATHNIIGQLDRSFITPFDREDIYRLAVRLDDVIDFMDAAVDLAALYNPEALPDGVLAQVDVLEEMARLTADAMSRLSTLRDLTPYWIKINELENDADHTYRRLLSYLFSGELEPLTVMKLKEIIDQLESAADAFEHVADVVHSIAVKES
jgi:predicted phosphate transport protein (TIGR00153 family)